MSTLALADAPIKPKLRGVSHGAGFFAALVAGVWLVSAAPGPTARLACAVYALSLCTLLGVSGLYHLVTWSPEARQRMRRLDHSAIFVLIAGTYTPLAITLAAPSAQRMLALAWVGAALGVFKALAWSHGPKWVLALLAVAVGWVAAIYTMPLLGTIGLRAVLWMAAGGALYSIGALIYAVRRPNPWPEVFGYHEVFHALVITAAVCHFVAVSGSLGVMPRG